MVEKLGASLGEKLPDLGSKVWEQVSNLKGLLRAKAPETAALLEAAESAPALINDTPDVFGLPVLTGKVEALATAEPEIATLINTLDSEVRPQLPSTFQNKVVQQVMLKGVKAQTIKAQSLTQEADASATQVIQEMLTDVDAGNIDLGDVSQT
ncbi:hypothetical protein [Trichocoleus sp. FACHB-591]|uniref:hypothetical protein n=1 Tax=Trichocoleus sp. FACHB-591 TaxID=2692872 RepID=UPI0018EF6F62|nr:hypothetical protein [Trichocoleus sp. FACHB-591]